MRCGDPDGGGRGRVPGGVGKEVVHDLHDPLPVGHHQGEIQRQVDEDVVSDPPLVPVLAGVDDRYRRLMDDWADYLDRLKAVST